jgi:hypothetical protein
MSHLLRGRGQICVRAWSSDLGCSPNHQRPPAPARIMFRSSIGRADSAAPPLGAPRQCVAGGSLAVAVPVPVAAPSSPECVLQFLAPPAAPAEALTPSSEGAQAWDPTDGVHPDVDADWWNWSGGASLTDEGGYNAYGRTCPPSPHSPRAAFGSPVASPVESPPPELHDMLPGFQPAGHGGESEPLEFLDMLPSLRPAGHDVVALAVSPADDPEPGAALWPAPIPMTVEQLVSEANCSATEGAELRAKQAKATAADDAAARVEHATAKRASDALDAFQKQLDEVERAVAAAVQTKANLTRWFAEEQARHTLALADVHSKTQDFQTAHAELSTARDTAKRHHAELLQAHAAGAEGRHKRRCRCEEECREHDTTTHNKALKAKEALQECAAGLQADFDVV